MMPSFMLVSRQEGVVTEGILSADSAIRSANDQFGVLMHRNMDRLLLSRGTNNRLTVPSAFHLPPTGRMLGHVLILAHQATSLRASAISLLIFAYQFSVW